MNFRELIGIGSQSTPEDEQPSLQEIVEIFIYQQTKNLPKDAHIDPEFVVSLGITRLAVETPRNLFIFHPLDTPPDIRLSTSKILEATKATKDFLKTTNSDKQIVQFWILSSGVEQDLTDSLVSHSALALGSTKQELQMLIKLINGYEVALDSQFTKHLRSLISSGDSSV